MDFLPLNFQAKQSLKAPKSSNAPKCKHWVQKSLILKKAEVSSNGENKNSLDGTTFRQKTVLYCPTKKSGKPKAKIGLRSKPKPKTFSVESIETTESVKINTKSKYQTCLDSPSCLVKINRIAHTETSLEITTDAIDCDSTLGQKGDCLFQNATNDFKSTPMSRKPGLLVHDTPNLLSLKSNFTSNHTTPNWSSTVNRVSCSQLTPDSEDFNQLSQSMRDLSVDELPILNSHDFYQSPILLDSEQYKSFTQDSPIVLYNKRTRFNTDSGSNNSQTLSCDRRTKRSARKRQSPRQCSSKSPVIGRQTLSFESQLHSSTIERQTQMEQSSCVQDLLTYFNQVSPESPLSTHTCEKSTLALDVMNRRSLESSPIDLERKDSETSHDDISKSDSESIFDLQHMHYPTAWNSGCSCENFVCGNTDDLHSAKFYFLYPEYQQFDFSIRFLLQWHLQGTCLDVPIGQSPRLCKDAPNVLFIINKCSALLKSDEGSKFLAFIQYFIYEKKIFF